MGDSHSNPGDGLVAGDHVAEAGSMASQSQSQSQSSSTAGYLDTGRHRLSSWLRSIVMSRICFDIFIGFHPTGVGVFRMRDLAVDSHAGGDGRPDFARDYPTKEVVKTLAFFCTQKKYCVYKLGDSHSPTRSQCTRPELK